MKRPPLKPTAPYTAGTVCRLTRVSYRRLDYWARTGLVRPSVRPAQGSGEGKHRLYSEADVDRVRLIGRLLHMGVSLQAVRRDADPRKTASRLAAELLTVVAEPPVLEAAS